MRQCRKWWNGLVLAGVFASLLMAVTGVAVADQDEGSKIVITSPADGAKVDGQSLIVTYELTRGAKATHAHVYLDGAYQKGFKGTLTNLPPGKHEIKVVAATDDHESLAAEASIHIEVE